MIIAQGAEAIIYQEEKGVIIKERKVKSYRHPIIDKELRVIRTRREGKILQVLEKNNFPAPRVKIIDDSKMILLTNFLSGKRVRDIFNNNPLEYAEEIGHKLGLLHNLNIIHADMTTSNMILNKEIFFIDFGLSYITLKIEDRAMDLHLLDRCLESSHYQSYPSSFDAVLLGYRKVSNQSDKVIERLLIVKKRGRNKNKGS